MHMWVKRGVGTDSFLVLGKEGMGSIVLDYYLSADLYLNCLYPDTSLVLFRITLMMALVGSNCIRNRT